MRAAALAAALLLALLPVPFRADELRAERVTFAHGATSATVEARIRGRETVDYILRIAAGQPMNISMATDNGANYFNILEPGEHEVAIFNGSVAAGGNQFEGVAARSGDYTIRVYLMRSAARRNEVANYRLEMIVSPAAAPAEAENDTALRAGERRFDATGDLPCALVKGQPMFPCPFGVARLPGGTATVVVDWPDGRSRTLFFEKGAFLAADTSEADGNPTPKVSKEADLWMIRLGDERYEFPDAVIFGG